MLVNPHQIPLKSAAELARMREAGRLLQEVFEVVGAAVKPGVTTGELDALAREAIERGGARPAFLGYLGFPASICASVNTELVHGIPSRERVLHEGDLLSVDIGLVRKGWHSDRAVTFAVGEVTAEARRLMDVTELSFWAGASRLVAGARLGECQSVVQRVIESAGMHVIEKYVGHGIGRKLHEPPQIPNYGRPDEGPRLKEGMVLAVEPMVGLTTAETRELNDRWTVVMKDGGLSAHYEHTVAVTGDGPEILTWSAAEAAAGLERGARWLAENG